MENSNPVFSCVSPHATAVRQTTTSTSTAEETQGHLIIGRCKIIPPSDVLCTESRDSFVETMGESSITELPSATRTQTVLIVDSATGKQHLVPIITPKTSVPVIPPKTSVPVIPPTTSVPVIPPTTSVAVIPPTTSVPVIHPTTSGRGITPKTSVPVISPNTFNTVNTGTFREPNTEVLEGLPASTQSVSEVTVKEEPSDVFTGDVGSVSNVKNCHGKPHKEPGVDRNKTCMITRDGRTVAILRRYKNKVQTLPVSRIMEPIVSPLHSEDEPLNVNTNGIRSVASEKNKQCDPTTIMENSNPVFSYVSPHAKAVRQTTTCKSTGEEIQGHLIIGRCKIIPPSDVKSTEPSATRTKHVRIVDHLTGIQHLIPVITPTTSVPVITPNTSNTVNTGTFQGPNTEVLEGLPLSTQPVYEATVKEEPSDVWPGEVGSVSNVKNYHGKRQVDPGVDRNKKFIITHEGRTVVVMPRYLKNKVQTLPCSRITEPIASPLHTEDEPLTVNTNGIGSVPDAIGSVPDANTTTIQTIENNSHSFGKLFKCTVCCEQVFKTCGDLKDHLKKAENTKDKKKENRPEEKKRKCSICDKMYTSIAILTKHIQTHFFGKFFKCTVCCKKIFKTRGALKNHLLGAEIRKCALQKKKKDDTRQTEFVQEQVTTMVEELDTVTEHCRCNYDGCGRDIMSHTLDELRDHIKSIVYIDPMKGDGDLINSKQDTGELPHHCDTCGEEFRTKRQLWSHVKRFHEHTSGDPWTCEICEKQFSVFRDLQTHRQKHEEEKQYICHICAKRFYWSNSLTVHIEKSHEGVKPHKCESCEKCFRSHNHLLRHVLVHTGEKPYTCDICNHRFTQLENPKTHLNRHTKSFNCSKCHKSFTSDVQLRSHRPAHTIVDS